MEPDGVLGTGHLVYVVGPAWHGGRATPPCLRILTAVMDDLDGDGRLTIGITEPEEVIHEVAHIRGRILLKPNGAAGLRIHDDVVVVLSLGQVNQAVNLLRLAELDRPDKEVQVITIDLDRK